MASDLITALRADPLDPDKVHVFIDGEHRMSVALDVAAAERLTVGQPCSPERVQRLRAAQEMHNIYERAIRYLSYRPRSAREVEMQMRKKGYTPDQISALMDKLRDRGYVDDREFARFWVNSRMTFSPRGPRLLKSELRQKGVPQAIVDEVLAEVAEQQAEAQEEAAQLEQQPGDEDEPVPGTDLANAIALASKRARSYANLDDRTARRRLVAFLLRRGYDYGTIDTALKRVLASNEEEEPLEE